jgi:hypothetical protein
VAIDTSLFPPHYFATLIAALFGTLAGAFVTGRVQARKAVTEELRSIAGTIHICYSICNTAIALKKQHVAPMRDRYLAARQQYLNAVTAARPGVPLQFELMADFQTLTEPKMPSSILERQVFDKIGVHGRGLIATVELLNAIEALSKTMNYRDALITEIDSRKLPPGELAELYFGTRTKTGSVNAKFQTSIEAIYLATDDCIFFARQVARDLEAYGKALRRKQRWKMRWFLPTLPRADITAAAGLIPNDEEYAGWLKGFKETRPWYQRMAMKVAPPWDAKRRSPDLDSRRQLLTRQSGRSWRNRKLTILNC